MDDSHTITADGISATVLAHGAELCSLRGADGTEYLWQAAPIWPRHAPILFPVVGRLNGDTLRVGGREFRMGQHGFARNRTFAWLERGPAGCRLELCDDAATHENFPFAFRLVVAYAVGTDGLSMELTVENPGPEVLPASLGLHPAFAWPLRPGLPRQDHRIVFAEPEPAPIRRLTGGLLLPDPVASPITGRTLMLADSLFAEDAVILDRPASRAARYTVPGGPALDLAWNGFPLLGVWSKPADFVCIEPWAGHADPVGFTGDVFEKPGMTHLPAGGRMQAELRVVIKNHSDDD